MTKICKPLADRFQEMVRQSELGDQVSQTDSCDEGKGSSGFLTGIQQRAGLWLGLGDGGTTDGSTVKEYVSGADTTLNIDVADAYFITKPALNAAASDSQQPADGASFQGAIVDPAVQDYVAAISGGGTSYGYVPIPGTFDNVNDLSVNFWMYYTGDSWYTVSDPPGFSGYTFHADSGVWGSFGTSTGIFIRIRDFQHSGGYVPVGEAYNPQLDWEMYGTGGSPAGYSFHIPAPFGWTMVTMTYSADSPGDGTAGTMTGYANGLLMGQGSWSGNSGHWTRTFQLGQVDFQTGLSGYVAAFPGLIDEYTQYNFVLTLDEVQELYSQGGLAHQNPQDAPIGVNSGKGFFFG